MSQYDHYTYEQALHGIQTTIQLMISNGWAGCGLKHLRVGIDSCMITEHAVATLLINKGIITKEEYLEALRKCAIEELERSTAVLSQQYGVEVTLG